MFGKQRRIVTPVDFGKRRVTFHGHHMHQFVFWTIAARAVEHCLQIVLRSARSPSSVCRKSTGVLRRHEELQIVIAGQRVFERNPELSKNLGYAKAGEKSFVRPDCRFQPGGRIARIHCLRARESWTSDSCHVIE